MAIGFHLAGIFPFINHNRRCSHLSSISLGGFLVRNRSNRNFAFSRDRTGSEQNRQRSTIHTALFYGVFSLLAATNILTLVGFLMSADIAKLINGQNERVFDAYENRIAQLRTDIDRLHSRQYAQEGNLNLQLQELTQQQAVLLEQHSYVRSLATKAQELGLEGGVIPTRDDIITGSVTHGFPSNRDTIESTAAAVTQMMDENRLALSALSTAANTSTNQILSELNQIGIAPVVPVKMAIGGPLIPARNVEPQPNLIDMANEVSVAFDRFKVARNAIGLAPVHSPVASNIRISSGFGNRRDPFSKRKAFHSGLDFAAARGTAVSSAGSGTVKFAGKKSGYGNVVEIDHGDGLITRYAHLFTYLVETGDKVEAGAIIGKSGSTGRSTGPHLHFEVRNSSGPLNPAKFLSAGRRLARFL
jgi:murein DD-endopeptidase MepM/ murein hydrolase activator NlpD